MGGEKRAWYTLFAHAQFLQDFWESIVQELSMRPCVLLWHVTDAIFPFEVSNRLEQRDAEVNFVAILFLTSKPSEGVSQAV